MNGPPEPAEVRSLHAAGPSGNVAVASFDVPLQQEAALADVIAAASTLPRWQHAASRGPVVWLTRRTRLFRFVDDVVILAEPRDGGTRLLVRSASRVGRRDFGQNKRNITELEAPLTARLESTGH